MSASVARIVLAVVMLPLAVCVYLVAFLAFDHAMSGEGTFLLANFATGAFVVLYWLVLWREAVRWTSYRVSGTALALAGCTLVGFTLGFAMIGLRFFDEAAILIGGMLAVALWLAITTLIWTETREERENRRQQATGQALFCTRCGYNMRGLHEARCPECGTEYTLEQLFAAQRKDQFESIP